MLIKLAGNNWLDYCKLFPFLIGWSHSLEIRKDQSVWLKKGTQVEVYPSAFDF